MNVNQNVQNAALIASAAAPLLGPNAQLALALAQVALGAVQAIPPGNTDITNEQLAAMFDQYAAHSAANKAATDAAA